MNSRSAAVVAVLRRRLFSSWLGSAVTLVIVYLSCKAIPLAIDWAVLRAVWLPRHADLCRAPGSGACWAFVVDKYHFLLFGTFPYEERWRPAAAIVLIVGLYGLSAWRRLSPAGLAAIWAAILVVIGALLRGGIFGMAYVESERWGGLTLTLLLATVGIACAFPLGVVLALARRSAMPLLRWIATTYIESVRGVPLISVLFMASVMLPIFLPAGLSIDKLLRAQLAMIFFAAAYLAEVVRGGLQAIPRQQDEAAQALGLSYWQRTGYVILPQALRVAVPALVNTFIGFFKDTSLVVIIGLFDFLTTIKLSLTEPRWSGFGIEAYLVAAAGYFIFCYPMSRYSRRLEMAPAARSAAPAIATSGI